MYDRELPAPLKVPKIIPVDYWLKGYKAGYQGVPAKPPRGRQAAENYWRGYGEGQADRARRLERA